VRAEQESIRADAEARRADAANTLRSDGEKREETLRQENTVLRTTAQQLAGEMAEAKAEAKASTEAKVVSDESCADMRARKNQANSGRRAAEQKSKALENETAKLKNQSRDLRAQLGGSAFKTPRHRHTNIEELVRMLHGKNTDIDRLTDELEQARVIISDYIDERERNGMPSPFLQLVGKKGEEYSQDCVELGFKVMLRSLSSKQAYHSLSPKRATKNPLPIFCLW
jgi:hypothetical protein